MLKKALTIEDLTKICHVPTATVLRWIQAQNLKTVRTSISQPMVWRSDLIPFLESLGQPIPRDLVCIDTITMVIAEQNSEQLTWIRNIIQDLYPNATLIEAHDAFETGQHVIDIIPHILIIDADIPGINGTNICRIIKNNHRLKFMKIICFGDDTVSKYKDDYLKAGADVFLPKPLLVNSFKDAVVFQANELSP